MPKPNTRNLICQGLAAAWPICLGYLPIGLAFGVIAQKAGLSTLQIGLMSLLVFAGSAQFIAVSMLAGGAGLASIVLTTFAVNLRHVLMSSSLALYLGGTGRRLLSLFAYGVTDESFVVNLSRFQRGNWGIMRALVVNHSANLVWISATIAGGYAGEFIPEGLLGLDYALTAMFIGLLVTQLRGKRYLLTAFASASMATGFYLWLPGSFYVIAASILAASLRVTITTRAGKAGTDV